jgi:hypothetical protein
MSVEIEREVIAMAACGLLALDEALALPSSCFTTEARLLAWACARKVLRREPRFRGIYAAQMALVHAPRLDMPLDDWADLLAETRAELDACERIETFDPAAPARLLTLTTTTKG